MLWMRLSVRIKSHVAKASRSETDDKADEIASLSESKYNEEMKLQMAQSEEW